jgi:hypothetical protein
LVTQTEIEGAREFRKRYEGRRRVKVLRG